MHITMYNYVHVFQVKASSEVKDVDFEVKQFHFTGWPDHGVPSCAKMILSFHECLHKQALGTPLLVHCR